MDKSSTSSISNQQMLKMEDLLEEITEIQKSNQNPEKIMIRVEEIIKESSSMVEDSTLSNEVVLDAKILHIGSDCINSNVSSLVTNLTSFNEDKYINGVLNYIEEISEDSLSEIKWDNIAPSTYTLFKKSEPVTFMLGPLKLKATENVDSVSKEKVERQKRSQQQTEKITLASSDDYEPVHQEDTSDVYKHIFKCLIQEYIKNNKKPINYAKFILDPKDFWKTIENIFHFSFLIRDGSVKMCLINDEIFTKPMSKKSNDNPVSGNVQFCLTLSYDDWKKLVEKFEITKPCISPIELQSKK